MSIFKRLFGEKEDLNNGHTQVFKPHVNNANIKSIGSNLQKKFSRGVQYNMKIVIRGDRNVGKSALLARLKGLEFTDQYIPTDEIEVACIHWNYKTNDDVVKVEVWDVVDKGRKKKTSGLKFENHGEDNSGSMCLDAEFLDVYKGAHAVIMVLDITKSWTLSYVERELQSVPDNIPVLVLANHRDMGSHRTVSTDQIQCLVESTPSFKKGLIKYWESSMKNGYGLIYIHRFFNLPFLQLQRDTLLKQLSTNENEMSAVIQELEDLETEPDSMYDNFISNLKSAKINSCQVQKPSSLTINSNPNSQINSPSTPMSNTQLPHKSSTIPITDNCTTSSSERNIIHPPQARPIPGMEKLGLYPLPVPGSDTKSKNDDSIPVPKVLESNNSKNNNKKNIDEFVPEDQPGLSSFLEEFSSGRSPKAVPIESVDSSSDDDDFYTDTSKGSLAKKQNPMVASFQDDIDIDDVANVDNSVVHETFGNDTASSDEENSYTLSSHVSQLNGTIKKTQIVTSSIIPSSEDTNELNLASDDIIDHGTTLSFPHVELKSSDIDILEQMTFQKELDVDNATLHSNSSTKKKKKKHHKDSNKDHQSKKKKKKSKIRSRDSSPKEINKSNLQNDISNNMKLSKQSDTNTVTNSIHRSIDSSHKSDRSDSLERFLND